MNTKIQYREDIAAQLYGIVQKVEGENACKFSFDEICSIFSHTSRKCEINGKGEDYIPILFENELTDFLTRREINRYSEAMRCARFADTLPV